MQDRISRRSILTTGLAFAATGTRAEDLSRYNRLQTNVLFADRQRFPIGVWLQDPANARAWQSCGINLYVGLWKGPTIKQLDTLAAAGMPVIAKQNPLALNPRYRKIIIGWLAQPDEPDNAQPIPGSENYGPPVSPKEMLTRYRTMQSRDPDRPVLLNLGQGITWDGWFGRGNRTGHPEDYPHYIEAADIVSFDVYPVTSAHAAVKGRIELIGSGVRRLRGWAKQGQGVWAVIGASRIGNPSRKPTPFELRAQAFMAIVHGAQGIVWFVHQFAPNFVEAAALRDPETRAALTEVNSEIAALAPILNQGQPEPSVQIEPASTISIRALNHNGALYLICINNSSEPTSVQVALPDNRQVIDLLDGTIVQTDATARFEIAFGHYEPRLFRVG